MDTLNGKNIRLRPVVPEDAAFILSLRIDPSRNRYVSPVDNNLTQQTEWIKRYQLREQQGEEFYYIIENFENSSLGTVRIYDFDRPRQSFSWGSWILSPAAPRTAAVESSLLVYQHGFGPLGFQQAHFEVQRENLSVVRFHTNSGAKIVREDHTNYYFEMQKETYYEFNQKRIQTFL